jgi:hypothetical protein
MRRRTTPRLDLLSSLPSEALLHQAADTNGANLLIKGSEIPYLKSLFRK